MTKEDTAAEALDDGWEDLEAAAQLWSLLDPARGQRIDAILDRIANADGDTNHASR